MSEPVPRRMSLKELLGWDDGTDTRYGLIDGMPGSGVVRPEDHACGAIRLDALEIGLSVDDLYESLPVESRRIAFPASLPL